MWQPDTACTAGNHLRQKPRHWEERDECRGTVGSMRWLLALQQFRRSEGEVTELILVDGRDHRVFDGREGGLFLSKIWVKVVDVLWCFLKRDCKEFFISSSTKKQSEPFINYIHTPMPSMKSWLTILGLKGGSISLRFSFSQSMSAKKAWLVTALSLPSEATQPRRRAGFLVNNCENQKSSQTCETKSRIFTNL